MDLLQSRSQVTAHAPIGRGSAETEKGCGNLTNLRDAA
jgi:hypothetical protein